MFEMSGKGGVGAANSPAVFAVEDDTPGADVDHRFDADDHAGAQDRGSPGATKIWNFGFFMHFFSAAMSNQVSHHTESGLFDDLFDSTADVIDAIAIDGRRNPCKKGFFGDFEQLSSHSLGGDSGADCTGIVPGIASQSDTDIEADQVAFADDSIGSSDAMNNLFIDGDADLSGVAIIAKKRTFPAAIPDETFREVVEVGGT